MHLKVLYPHCPHASAAYFHRRKSETESEEKVPIRWMAPESIENDIYDESIDVVRTVVVSCNCPHMQN